LVFYNEHIVAIEIKFSTKNNKDSIANKSPMWNSNLPKDNPIYIYGILGVDVTFFKGVDILDNETRKPLINYFNTIKNLNKYQNDLNDKLSKNNLGFYPYIRITYKNQNNQQRIESLFSENRTERENNVLDFIKKLDIKRDSKINVFIL